MTVDPKIQEAIENAVSEAGQNEGVARKLIRWFEALASGNESVTDKQSAYRHLELLYEETQPPAGQTLSQLLDASDETHEPEDSF